MKNKEECLGITIKIQIKFHPDRKTKPNDSYKNIL